MSVERTLEGGSQKGDFWEALKKTLGKLGDDIGEDGVRDGSASWTLEQISGMYSG